MPQNPFNAMVYAAIAGLVVYLWTAGAGPAVNIFGPLADLALALGYLVLLFFAGCFYRYEALLGEGEKPVGTLERTDYDALRVSLQTGGQPVQLYTDWLTAFLNAVDRFFGDAHLTKHGWAARLFGLHTPAPLWTASAYDRCLLLALLYPVATIFLIWGISGHVGPAEATLGLVPDIDGWRRGLFILTIPAVGLATWLALRTNGWESIMWLTFSIALVVSGGIAGDFAIGGAFAYTAAFAFAFAFAVAVAGAAAAAAAAAGVGAVAGVGAAAVAVTAAAAVAGAAVVAGAGAFAATVAAAVVGVLLVVAAAAIVYFTMRNRRKLSVFMILFSLGMIAFCLGAPYFLSGSPGWEKQSGPLLLFLGLLTLLNAPFDWLSLGLTRGLLRRGIELGGWWPYLLALADAIAAVAIVVLLSFTMVIGIQIFDYFAVLGGGEPVLPLRPLLAGILANPYAPEYWWVYALLLSTMIPSLINLAISGVALLRGIPGLRPFLLRFMPSGHAVPAYDRTWLALALTFQWAAGITLGIAAQFILLWFIAGRLMPWLGIGLLDMARDLEAFNLPLQAHQFF